MTAQPSDLASLLEAARRVTAEVIAPAAARLDAEAAWPEEPLRALGEAGLLALNAPRDVGGHGHGLAGLAAVARVIAHESPSVALCYAMHCVGTAVLAAKATERQREVYLRPIARGEHVTTLALSEPGTGSHFYIPETRLAREDDGYVLSGTKSFVTNGGHADSYVLSTVGVQPGGQEGAFSVVVLDAGRPGMEWSPPWSGLGMRANSSRTVTLTDVPIPADNLLGEEGDQLWYVFEVVAPYFLVAMAGTYAGIAEACVALARESVGSRRHSHTGELLGADPVVAHRLGALWTRAQGARCMLESAAAAGDAGVPDALTRILACKVAAVDAAVETANEAMTLAGGRAYGANNTLARMLRDARAGHVMAPTTDHLLTWIGRTLLDLPLL